jgi:hypothetical protein
VKTLVVASIVATAVVSGPAAGQRAGLADLRTRAEATQYRETSRYDDVMAFIRAVDAAWTAMHVTTFGYTIEGRALPLVVVGDVRDATPETVRASGKTRVFIQANIHAGEVCGKEAMLMLLRDMAGGAHAHWADSLVLLIAPIYNADGNERVLLTNRPRQHGPVAGMGQRPNAQGYDLNRDHMKLDSPEARSLVALMNAYDPHVAIDLHTTNGSRHAYHITYSPPLHPNTDSSITRLLREEWLPAVQDHLRQGRGWESYYYGNAFRPQGADAMGWYTFDHRPRFNNNYVGLRNRFAILSEAYSYATFEERVLATLTFVEGAVDFAHANAARVRTIVEAVDDRAVTGTELGLRAEFENGGPVDILMGEVDEVRNPYSGEVMLLRRDVVRAVQMNEYGAFTPTEWTRAPAAYLVPANLTGLLHKLADHGVRTMVLQRNTTLAIEEFVIDSAPQAAREFQQHRERTVFGAYRTSQQDVPAGTVIVPIDQPLGRLVFTLLEPRSDDGLANWNVLDEALEQGGPYPVLRTHRPVPGR